MAEPLREPKLRLQRQDRGWSVETPDLAWQEQRRRQAAVDLHRRTLGDWCPGLVDGRSHEVLAPNRLTTAHGAAAVDDPRDILVLCQTCGRSLAAAD